MWIEWFLEPWSLKFMQTAALMSVLLGGFGGMAGTLIVTQRSALQVESLAHGLLPGLILTYLWVGSSLLGLFVGGAVTVLLTRILSKIFAIHRRTDQNTAMAIVIALNFSVGLILLNVYRGRLSITLDHLILGDLLASSQESLWAVGGCLGIFSGLLWIYYRPLKAYLFDQAYVRQRGWSIMGTSIALEIVISIATLLSFQAVGVILTLALMTVPAATIQLMAQRLWHLFVFGGALGAIQGISGILFSYYFNWPSAPAIIIISVICYVVVLGLTRFPLKTTPPIWIRKSHFHS